MRAEISWIEAPWQGKLAIVPRPRGGDWLEDEVRKWRLAGVSVAVSLLTNDEIADLDLVQEARLCRENGIQYLSFPITDRSVPASRRATWEFAKKLEIHAPLAGMVVHELLPRAGTLGKAQEGDQIFRGYPLASIFDPSQMLVRCSINEPDVTALLANARVTVHLDAYPDLTLPAHFVSASPVASSGLGTPIKTFVAVFGLDKNDPHLLPDLSAAVVLTIPAAAIPPGGTK